MGKAPLVTPGLWTHQRSPINGARSQMQGRCPHPGQYATTHGVSGMLMLVADQICHARMYATAAARGDGLLLLCGGRDASGTPMGDAYGFARHRDGRWEWHAAPGAMPTGRYQHGAIFVGNRLHISGGAVGGGRMVGCRRSRALSPLASSKGMV